MRAYIEDKKYPLSSFGRKLKAFLLLTGVISVFVLTSVPTAYATKVPAPGTNGSGTGSGGTSTLQTGDANTGKYQCGSGASAVYTAIDIGCKGSACKSSNANGCSALTDAIFAIIRFLSIGVGLVVVASMIWAGLQYTTSRDDPTAVGKAKERILNNIIALLVYIFSYAILNYLIPKGFFG